MRISYWSSDVCSSDLFFVPGLATWLPAQMIGIFAFQTARRLTGKVATPVKQPRLHPRPRDCVVLAGRGCSNKQIARMLGITPRTVDGYLTEARRLFDRSEEHPSELPSLMRTSSAVFCLTKKTTTL